MIRSRCGSPARVLFDPFLTADPPTKVPVDRSRCFSACSFCRRSWARIRAVLAETLGARISGNGRSFNETFDRDLLLVARTGLAVTALALGEVFAGLLLGLAEPFDFFAGAALADADFSFSELPAFEPLAFALLLFDAGADALAFRRRRRWVFEMASTNSSFRMPCHPEMP